jgi:hypothetical protein
MAQYGSLDKVAPGTLDGLFHDFESRVANAVTQFGDPVMYDAGDEKKCYAPDSTDVSLVFGGVAVTAPRSYNSSVGEYPAGDQVSVVKSGEVWVKVPDGLTGCANKIAYVIDLIADGDYKKFTATSGANTYDSKCVFKGNPITFGAGKTYARVEVRGVQ